MIARCRAFTASFLGAGRLVYKISGNLYYIVNASLLFYVPVITNPLVKQAIMSAERIGVKLGTGDRLTVVHVLEAG